MEQNINNEIVAEMRQDRKMLTALFANHIDAENAYQYLIEKGYDKSEISFVMSEATRTHYFPNTSQGTQIESDSIDSAVKGTAIGGSIGVTVGAIVGMALAIGSNVIIPGFGFLLAGPLFAGLMGAGSGGIAGGIIGSLMGVGFGEDRAQIYEARLKNGEILMGIHCHDSDEESIKIAWKKIGGTEISS